MDESEKTSRIILPGQTIPPDRGSTDLLAAVHAHAVECFLVGAHASAARGHVRATEDLETPGLEFLHRTHRARTERTPCWTTYGTPIGRVQAESS